MWIVAVLAVILLAVISNIKIVPQSSAYVVERLGSFQAVWGNGIHLLIPVIDKVARRVSLKEQVVDFPPQSVITKDNVTMQIDTVVFMQITNPKLYAYGVDNPLLAIENLTATTLRNIIGDMELDETLTSRDTVNGRITNILDEASDKWGIKVNRVELKNIIPPKEIQQSMEKQMKAERDRRETLLEAEGHKQAIVTREEGNKQAKILAAQAEREAAIAKAEGEARAIELVYNAQARGLRLLREAAGDEGMLVIKKLEALEKLGNGRATKLIVPTDLTTAAKDLTVTGEMLGLSNDIPLDHSPIVEEKPFTVDECCEEAMDTPPNFYVPSEEVIKRLHKMTKCDRNTIETAYNACGGNLELTLQLLKRQMQ